MMSTLRHVAKRGLAAAVTYLVAAGLTVAAAASEFPPALAAFASAPQASTTPPASAPLASARQASTTSTASAPLASGSQPAAAAIWTACADHAARDAGARCGRLERPLDPMGIVPGTLAVYFEFYPHTLATAPLGTLVATEGGPGYPATGSRADYLALFEPLRAARDVLIMDNRGTGRSGAVDCRALQTGPRWTVAGVAACGESLGARASFYGTEYAADDLAAILDVLHIRKIDLYGDSYGTYFEQVFAVRHPGTLRSIILDGAYPLTGPDYAWYPSYAPAMRDKFNLACERSAACAALPGSSIDHVLPALESLRVHPFTARAYVDGRQRSFRADASRLAIVMYGSAPALTTTREVDAAARAFADGDRDPLLRLMAETSAAVDSRDPTGDPTKWSAGLAAAVLCGDPPQIVDMRLAPAQRALQRDAVLAARRRSAPGTYAPFTLDEYRGMPLDYSFLDLCVGWPVASQDHPASQVGARAVYPDIPALIISGELDNITTPADGAAVAAAFPHGVQIRIANSFHVNALPRARSDCAAQLVRQFIADATLGDTSCAARVPPLHLVARFVRHSGELDPATALPGNAAGDAQRRVVSAAVLTVGDVLARVGPDSSGRGVGLRGGTFRITQRAGSVHLQFDRVRWVEDVAVSGAIDRSSGRQRSVRAELLIAVDDGSAGQVSILWTEGIEPIAAHIVGSLAGAPVRAQSVAP